MNKIEQLSPMSENSESSSKHASVESLPKSPKQQRTERLVEVKNDELEQLGNVPKSSEELQTLFEEKESFHYSRSAKLCQTSGSENKKDLFSGCQK